MAEAEVIEDEPMRPPSKLADEPDDQEVEFGYWRDAIQSVSTEEELLDVGRAIKESSTLSPEYRDQLKPSYRDMMLKIRKALGGS